MDVDGMAAAFTKQAAAMGLQMSNQVDALHARLGAESLSDHRDAGELLFRECTIGFQDQLDRVTKVRSRFFECFALRVRARQFLDERDIAPFGSFPEDGRQFQGEWLGFHGLNVQEDPADV